MKIAHQFDQQELDSRIANATAFYESAYQDHKSRGAIVVLSESYFFKALQDYDQLRGEGYTLFPSLNFSPDCIYLRKPQALIDKDIEDITEELTIAYNTERKSAYDAHLEQVISQSLDRERRSAEKKQADAEAKLRAKLEADALQALGEFK